MSKSQDICEVNLFIWSFGWQGNGSASRFIYDSFLPTNWSFITD